MKDFWKKHKISLIIIGFILTIPPLFYWSFLFMTERIQAKADLIQEKMIDNNLEKAKINKIPEMEKANAEFEKSKEAVGTILSSGSKVDFIEYVEKLAEDTNNKIELKVLEDSKSDNKPDAKAKTKTAAKKETDGGEEGEKKNIEDGLLYKQYISMQVDLEGNYAGLLNFVHKLENNKYYVNVLSFNLQKIFVEKEIVPQENAPNSLGIFLSPVSRSNSASDEVEQKGDPVLKSTLSIIVYTE